MFVFVIVGTLPFVNALPSIGHIARAHVGALSLHDPVAAPAESCAHVRVVTALERA